MDYKTLLNAGVIDNEIRALETINMALHESHDNPNKRRILVETIDSIVTDFLHAYGFDTGDKGL